MVILVVFSALRPTAASYAGIAGRRAALQSRARAKHAAAAAVQQDRRDRLALLEAEALPLLRAVADGSLDPADAGVRERCARHAAALPGDAAAASRTPSQERGPALGKTPSSLHLVNAVRRSRSIDRSSAIVGTPSAPSYASQRLIRAPIAAFGDRERQGPSLRRRLQGCDPPRFLREVAPMGNFVNGQRRYAKTRSEHAGMVMHCGA